MTDHSKGKELFAEGNYAGAAEAFSQAINANPDSKEAAMLYSNQAECMLKMNNNQAAAVLCEKSLQLDPCNAKSYNRLARALPKHTSKAAFSICSAIALCGNQVHGSLISLYKSIQQEVSHKDWMPMDHRRIRLINPGTQLPFRSTFETSLWIISPGSFDIIHTIAFTNSSSAVIGLGIVTIRCKMGHVFLTHHKSLLVLHNLSLVGDSVQAAICCSDSAQLKMSNCSITKNINGGILVCGASAIVENCSIIKCSRMAIEIREGGDLLASNLVICQCYQGIVAYGGARKITIDNCKIDNIESEGILLDSCYTNVAIDAQASYSGPRKSEVSQRADEWGKKRRVQLIATISNCAISCCKNFAISADHGSNVQVHSCELKRNLPCSLIVKGKTNLCVSSSKFIFTGNRLKYNLFLQKESGIHVGYNYDGNVEIICNAFCGPSLSSVVQLPDDSRHNIRRVAELTGMWSKPAIFRDNIYFSSNDSDQLPSVDELALRIPGGPCVKPKTAVGMKMTEDLCRISWTDRSVFPWSCSSQFYYPIGNSVGLNLLDKFIHDGEDTLHIFFGACGDIRNLIATAAAIPDAVSKTIIALNDENLTMLARNVVLLYLSVNSSPDVVLAVWANHGLTEFQGEELFKALSILASSTEYWPEWLLVASGRSESYSECLIEIFEAWLGSKLSLTEILKKRHSFMGEEDLSTAIDISVAITGPCYRKDIEHYMKTGSLPSTEKIPLVTANVTMMLAPTMQYAVYSTTSIFRVVEWPKSTKGSKGFIIGEAEKVISAALYPQILCTAKLLSDQKVIIRLVPGDIVSLLANQSSDLVAPNNIPYDFMDCTNVVDYVGLATIAQLCAPLLKKTSKSRLSFESMVTFKNWSKTAGENGHEFLSHLLLGLPLPCFEQLTGLRVVSTHITFPNMRNVNYIRLLWAPCDDARFPHQSEEDLKKTVTIYGQKVLSASAFIRTLPMPSPLSLVHLICSSFPENSVEILSNMMSTEDTSLFKMEVTMHAMIQLNKTPDLVVCTYVANCGFRAISAGTDPLVLVVSLLPLENEIIENPQRLISAFSWDGSMGVARFLFPRLLKETCRNWYITLGAFSSGILAIGTSALFSSLLTTEAENTNIWRKKDV